MRIYQVHGVLIIAVAAALLRHVALSLPATCSATEKEATAYCPSTSTSSAGNCGFPAIFNFGDSNSDTGGISAAFANFQRPLGVTFFHHPSGRMSDGRLIIDFIAESLGLPYLSAYLDSIGANFTHGVNFATGGSTIKTTNATRSQGGFSPISLDVQFIQFCQFQTRSQQVKKQGGVFEQLLPDEKVFSSALYTFDIGHNDLTSGYRHHLSTDQIKASVPDLIRQLSVTIQNIYAKGGRSFRIHNTDPIGCVPDFMEQFPVTPAELDEHGCAKPQNEVAQFYNLKLKEMVDELRTILPLASITYVDIYSVKYSLISNAKNLGFDDPFFVCYCHGGNYKLGCGDVNGAKVCEKPESRIIWDGTHYTEAANRWIFNQIVNGSFSDPPVPLSSACKH